MNTHPRNFASYKVTPAPKSVHPGKVFLLRASARFDLVEAGEMEIEEAIMGLAPSFYDLVHPMCNCASEIYERMERLHPDNSTTTNKERPTMLQAPEATVNAVEHETRNDGVAALATPGFKRRWAGLSAAQKPEIIVRLNWQRAKYPKITDELIQRLVEASK